MDAWEGKSFTVNEGLRITGYIDEYSMSKGMYLLLMG